MTTTEANPVGSGINPAAFASRRHLLLRPQSPVNACVAEAADI